MIGYFGIIGFIENNAQNNEANPSVALKNDNDHAIRLDVNIPPISKG